MGDSYIAKIVTPQKPSYVVKYFAMRNVHTNFQASTFKTDKPLDRSIFWSDFIKFSLHKVQRCIKIDFFSLKLSWNDFKVIHPWIEVKKCLHIKFGVNGGIEWGFEGGLKTLILSIFTVIRPLLKPSLNTPIDPKFYV